MRLAHGLYYLTVAVVRLLLSFASDKAQLLMDLSIYERQSILSIAMESYNQRHVTLLGITRNGRRCHLCPGRKSLKSRVPKGHVAVGQGWGAHARNVARRPEAVMILDMSWAYGAARTRCGRPRIKVATPVEAPQNA